jgi:competence protein ComGC
MEQQLDNPTKRVARRLLLIAVEAILVLIIIGLLLAFFLPAWIGGNPEKQ